MTTRSNINHLGGFGVKKKLAAILFLVFAAGLASASYAKTAPQYVPSAVALYKNGALVTEDGSYSGGGYYSIPFGSTVQFDIMAFPDSVTESFQELDETVISGDSFSIKFTPIVDGTSEGVSWSMTQEDTISNAKIDPKVRAQKIATLSITGVDYPNRKDSDHANIYINCEYSFKRPSGVESGITSKKSNVIAIKAVPRGGGGGGGGGCDSLGIGASLFVVLGGAFLLRRGQIRR
jgi:hypothetical protein